MADLAKLRIRLEADNRQLRAELTRTRKQVERFGKRTSKVARDVSRNLKLLAGTFISFQTISFAVREIAQFEETMSKVKAVTQATNDQMVGLTKTARQLGATTQFSAKEAAEGMEFLGRAGFETSEIIQAMPGLLDLAAAGALELGRAADIASNVLSGFRLEADQSNRVADVLAATAASSNTSVEQLGEAMAFVAPVAAAFGKSVEESAAAVGILGNAGLQGSTAGTGLRKVLSALANTTPATAKAIKALGLEVKDLNPNTNTLAELIRKLADAGLDGGSALTIFGERGGPAILALTSQIDDLEKLADEMKEVEGIAKKMAETMADNLAGDFRKLQSAMTELTLATGDKGLLSTLRSATQGLTEFTQQAATGDDGISTYLRNEFEGIIQFGGMIGKALADITGNSVQSMINAREDKLQDLARQQKRLEDLLLLDPRKAYRSEEATQQIVRQIQRIGEERRRLVKEIESYRPQQAVDDTSQGAKETEEGMKGTVEKTKAWSAELQKANQLLVESLSAISKQGMSLQENIDKVRKDINKKKGETLISGTLLQVKRDLETARSLADKGQTEDAVAKAKDAVELTKKLAEAGKISNSYANSLLNRAEAVGRDIVKVAAKIEIDRVEALKQGKELSDVLSEQSRNDPAKMYVVWESLNSPTVPNTPTLPEGASTADGSPITIQFPNSTYQAKMEGDDMDKIRAEFRRQNEQRYPK